jgi:Raf kinase inhibitor-like YbhB/YbcL family protein
MGNLQPTKEAKMEKLFGAMAIAFSGVLLLGFPSAAHALVLTSPAFKDGGTIPGHYARPAAGGHNMSIALEWTGAPEGTKSFAVSIVDFHPVAHKWVHWLVIDIPPNTASLREDASGKSMPSGAVELKNSFGTTGYGGPQPPKGSGPHPYVITVYALKSDTIDLAQNASLSDFQNAIKGKVIQQASITGHYEQ